MKKISEEIRDLLTLQYLIDSKFTLMPASIFMVEAEDLRVFLNSIISKIKELENN